MKTLGALALAAAIVMPFATSPARAQEPFYQNKRLTFLINFAAGGPSDIEGRLMTRHIGKYLAGNPALRGQTRHTLPDGLQSLRQHHFGKRRPLRR